MNENQVEFKPIAVVNDEFTEQKPSSDFYSNLEKVLTYYEVVYSVDKNGTVLVDKALREDTDLCWNYTTKANDSIWLSEH